MRPWAGFAVGCCADANVMAYPSDIAIQVTAVDKEIIMLIRVLEHHDVEGIC